VGDRPKTLPEFTDFPPIKIGVIAIGYQFIWIVVASLILIVLLALFFKKTMVGKAMRACAINRDAVALQTIPVARMLALSFALSAAPGAIAGILVTPTQYTAYNAGTPFAISGFIAVIVGGFAARSARSSAASRSASPGCGGGRLRSGMKNVAALSVLLIFFVPCGRKALWACEMTCRRRRSAAARTEETTTMTIDSKEKPALGHTATSGSTRSSAARSKCTATAAPPSYGGASITSRRSKMPPPPECARCCS
jgi:hypothetical protein